MDAPTAYKNAGLANLIGGVFSALAAFGVGLSFLMLCIGVIWIVPFGLACWQAWVGWQMYNGQAVGNAKTVSIVGIVAALCSFNILAAAAGAFAMLQCNEPDVAGWIEANA